MWRSIKLWSNCRQIFAIFRVLEALSDTAQNATTGMTNSYQKVTIKFNFNFFPNSEFIGIAPELAIPLSKGLTCMINAANNVAITGTSQLSGVSVEYVKTLHDIGPPFIYPLSCLEEGILSIEHKFGFIVNTVVNELKQLHRPLNCKLSFLVLFS